MDDELTLYCSEQYKDEYGVTHSRIRPRTILCRVGSVTRAEFFDAGRNGLNPEFMFTVFHGDYLGETTCRFHGQDYGIYRTYHVPGTDDLELYAERKGGTNGAYDRSGQRN